VSAYCILLSAEVKPVMATVKLQCESSSTQLCLKAVTGSSSACSSSACSTATHRNGASSAAYSTAYGNAC
jgi:hypothetical protein